MRSGGASPSPSRPVKCPNSSPTDSVAEVNIQALPRACTSERKRSEMSNGMRLSAIPRPPTSRVRAPSCSSNATMRARLAASSAARSARAAPPAVSPRASAADSSSSASSSPCASSRSRVLAADHAVRPGVAGAAARSSRSACSSACSARAADVAAAAAASGARGGRRRGVRARRRDVELDARVAQQRLELAAAHMGTEELRGEIGYLVGFVEDHRIGRAQQVAEAVLLQGQVGEQQVVVDDDQISLERLAARERYVAARDLRTAHAEAALARRGDLRPYGVGIGQTAHLRQVTALGGERPALDARGDWAGRAAGGGGGVDQGQLPPLGGAAQAVTGKVVGPAL